MYVYTCFNNKMYSRMAWPFHYLNNIYSLETYLPSFVPLCIDNWPVAFVLRSKYFDLISVIFMKIIPAIIITFSSLTIIDI